MNENTGSLPSKDAFPPDFLWGASTSSHQVEGNSLNQWTEWEKTTSHRQAANAEKRLGWIPNWPDFRDTAESPENYISGIADDHWNRYEEDFDLIQQLNLNAFRFSLEWSRIEPEEGEFDQAAIEHYKCYIAALNKRGITPLLNVWHWTNPVWFEKKGAFTKRANIKYFVRFAELVAAELTEGIDRVIILNEPNMYAWYSYGDDWWPPGTKSYLKFLNVYLVLAKAHRQAYKAMKQKKPLLQMTSAMQLVNNVPKNPKNPYHRFGAWTANESNNWLWYRLTRKCNDFIGFNNYFKNYMAGFGPHAMRNPGTPVNDMGWYMEPRALEEIILAAHKKCPNKKIIVTENGVADAKDQYRIWWLKETIAAMAEAVQAGAPLIGYFHWSLLDNFEWQEGWWPKFGLIAVDREGKLKRTVKPSGEWLAVFLKNRS